MTSDRAPFPNRSNELTNDLSPLPLGDFASRSPLMQETNQSAGQGEHTLLGKVVISPLRNLIQGSPDTAQERAERAHSNDGIAHLVADTAAFLPRFGWVAGGAIRAGLLIDPTRAPQDQLGNFALNFATGSLLNKAGRIAMPESAVSKALTARFGTGLVSEGLTHMTAGLAFGAARTGLDPLSWKDEQGKFSLTTGLENVGKATALAGAFNVPAGMIGMRVARASTVMMGQGSLSPRMASIIGGVGSGYAAGGVFGGLDAVMQGKSGWDILKGINTGGLIGAGTGALVAGTDKNLVMLRNITGNRSIAEPQNNAESAAISTRSVARREFTVQELSAGTSKREPVVENVKPGQRKRIEEAELRERSWSPHDDSPETNRLFQGMDFVPLKLPIDKLTVRLGAPVTEKGRYAYLEEGQTGPFKSMDDLIQRAKTGERDVLVYPVKGHKTTIEIPVDYAQALEPVRALRQIADRPTILDALPDIQYNRAKEVIKSGHPLALRQLELKYSAEATAEFLPIMRARIALDEHPLGARALPEDFIPFMDELPVKSRLKVVEVLDEMNYQDPWHRQTYDPEFVSSAGADQEFGVVSFFRANRDDPTLGARSQALRETFFHEDSHLVPGRAEYERAVRLERGLTEESWSQSKYARRDAEENWAEHRGANFLQYDADNFMFMAEGAPIRTSIIARELAESMQGVPARERSPHASSYRARINYVEERVIPEARKNLVKHLQSGQPEDMLDAASLLGSLGSEKEISALATAVALNPNTKLARTAMRSIEEIQSAMPGDRIAKLFAVGYEHPSIRDDVVARLKAIGRHEDMRASDYADLLELAGNPNNSPQVYERISTMPDPEGRALAFRETLHLIDLQSQNMIRGITGNSTSGRLSSAEEITYTLNKLQSQNSVARMAIENHPELRMEALEVLGRNIRPEIEGFELRIGPEISEVLVGLQGRGNTRAVVEKAAQIQAQLDGLSAAAIVNRTLDAGRQPHLRTVQRLADAAIQESIPALVRVAVQAPDHSPAQTLALQSLSQFSQQLVKSYARMLKPIIQPGAQSAALQSIIDGRYTMQLHLVPAER